MPDSHPFLMVRTRRYAIATLTHKSGGGTPHWFGPVQLAYHPPPRKQAYLLASHTAGTPSSARQHPHLTSPAQTHDVHWWQVWRLRGSAAGWVASGRVAIDYAAIRVRHGGVAVRQPRRDAESRSSEAAKHSQVDARPAPPRGRQAGRPGPRPPTPPGLARPAPTPIANAVMLIGPT